MKSIKPGRGLSFMGGVMSILVGLFGVVWTIVAASMGGGVFALFGIIFIAVAMPKDILHRRYNSDLLRRRRNAAPLM